MATSTSGGTTTSFTNTPQATDDSYIVNEDWGVTYFDVMSDDLGGNAKTLWSIDDTTTDGTTGTSGTSDGSIDLLTRDIAGVCNKSDLGARIWITADGRIGYDSSIFAYLAAGETATDHFTYAIRLSNGTLSWATVTVMITGTNDRPDISVGSGDSASASLLETDSPLSTSGTLTVVDPDTSDAVTVSVSGVSASGNSGSLTAGDLDAMLTLGASSLNADSGETSNLGWSFDSGTQTFDYLAADESLTLTYTVSADDGNGGTDTQTVTITITGTNDAPVLTVDDSGGVTEDVGVVSGNVADSGTLSFTDLDASDTHLVTCSYNGDANWSDGTLTTGQIAAITAGFSADSDSWDYSVANADLDFLGASETITFSFDVTVTDDSGEANDSDTKTVTITITGTNDSPTLDSAIADQHVDEDNLWSFAVPAGSFGDPDANDTLAYAATLGNGDPLPDWLTFDPDTQTFSGTPPQDWNGIISLTVSASDGTLSTSDTFDLVVDAVNDAPEATPVVLDAIDEDSGARIITQAELLAGASDVDGDTLTVTSLGIASGGGVLVDNGDGTWTYTPAANDDTSVTFNYTVSDGSLTDSSTATMDILPVDDFVYTSPAPYTGTGDPNDFDSLVGGTVNNSTSPINGTTGNDTITGGSANQTINGGNGNDTIYGGGGNDNINGGNDNDTLYGQGGIDTVDGNNGLDVIYGGSGNDNLAGGNDADTIYGGSGGDSITGLGGNDLIFGGYGADTLTGSGGADTFAFLSNLDTGDRITDFSHVDGDKLDLSAVGAKSGGFLGAISQAGAVGAHETGYMYDSGTNTTIVYVDTDGIFGADLEIMLTGNIALVSGDFVFGGP